MQANHNKPKTTQTSQTTRKSPSQICVSSKKNSKPDTQKGQEPEQKHPQRGFAKGHSGLTTASRSKTCQNELSTTTFSETWKSKHRACLRKHRSKELYMVTGSNAENTKWIHLTTDVGHLITDVGNFHILPVQGFPCGHALLAAGYQPGHVLGPEQGCQRCLALVDMLSVLWLLQPVLYKKQIGTHRERKSMC